MQKRWLVMILAALFGLMVVVGCSNDSNEAVDGDAPTDGDVDGDTDGDLPVDGDEPGDCDGVCNPDDGFYCDVPTQTCKEIICTPCADDFPTYYCSETEGSCRNVPASVYPDPDENDDDTTSFILNSGDYCLKTSVGGCPGGYESVDGICYPMAICNRTVPKAKPGDPCEYGPMFPGYKCAKGDSCVGIADLGTACEKTEDCYALAQQYNNIVEENVYCAGGVCGFSMCTTPCDFEGRCPVVEGLEDMNLYPDQISGNCLCGPDPLFAPVGSEPVGAICNPSREDQLPLCDPALMCLGAADYNSSCESVDDCTGDLDFGPNTYCSSAGYCAYSVCSSRCVNDVCEDGTNYVPNQNQCYCAPQPYGMPTGDARVGFACNTGDDDTLAYCEAGLHCRRTTNSNSHTCTADTDCPADVFGPNAFCGYNGFCAYSVCAEPCDENGECGANLLPLRNTPAALCLCAPAPYGGNDPF